MDKKVSRVLEGHIDDLPPGQSKVVRIFISSTFSDTYEERNLLIKNVYPKLKEYCRSKHDLDFQVVDMRWGVRDEASDDHVTSKLCLEEIQNCQNISVGPNFVAFIGQRYGYRPIPSTITSSEFLCLLKTLQTLDEDTSLLTQWYIEDTNCRPSVFILQKISAQIPDYISQNETERNRGKKLWNEVLSSLQNQLRKAVTMCNEKGQIDRQTCHRYHMSVTESEVEEGMFTQAASQSDHSSLCFVRLITDLEKHLDHQLAWRFIDMMGQQIDTEAQRLLVQLRDSKLPQKLGRRNMFESSVQWDNSTGINVHTHSGYLKQFCENFYTTMAKHIDTAMAKQKKLLENEVYTEVLQHALLASERCSLFSGREEVIWTIENLLFAAPTQPLVVYGQSGCGKTSIMAVCAQRVQEWIPNGKSSVVILRFLGITPRTSGIVQTLQSICDQIALNYNKQMEPVDSVNDLIQEFAELLKCATQQKPLVIIIDSLDQMSSAHHAHRLSWLPKELPKHVYMILSTLPSLHQILDRLKKKINPKNLVRIQSLGDELGYQVIQSWLASDNRGLTQNQSALVQNALSKCSLPLFVRLLYEEVSLWKSYMPIDTLQLSFTIRNVISDLFSRLERKHGHLFVRNTLAYITASKGGLSEMELEDVLSLDDEVLTDVFQFHVPPVRRIPQLVVVRVKHDVASYFVNKEVDGMIVTYWYHRQFIEAAHERYLKDKSFREATHWRLAEYFSGRWHKNPKPFKYSEQQMKKLKLSSPDAEADRLVMGQPLVFIDADSQARAKERFNTRKLGNLPYHLMQSNRKRDLLKSCLLNYKWLRAKIRAFSLQDALDDYQYMESNYICKKIVRSLNLARSTLSKNPNSLGSEILARLLYLNSNKSSANNTMFKEMLTQTIHCSMKENVLIPNQQIFAEMDERIMYTLEYPNLPKNWKIVFFSPDGYSMYAVAHPNEMAIWDLKTGELEKILKLWPATDPKMNVCNLSEDSVGQKRYCLMASCYQSKENPVTIVDMVTGEIVHSVKLENHYPSLAFPESVQMEMIGDRLLMNIVRKQCCLYQCETGRVVFTFTEKADIMHVPPSKKIVAFFMGSSKTVNIYTTHNTQLISSCSIEDPPSKVLSTFDVTVLWNKTSALIELWDFESAIPPKMITNLSFEKYTTHVKDIELSHDKHYLAVVHVDGVAVWNIHRNTFVQNCLIPSHCKPTNLNYKAIQLKASITANNEQVMCAFEDYLITWSLKKKQEPCVMNIANSTSRSLDIITSANIENNIAISVTAGYLSFRIIDVTKIMQTNQDIWIPMMKMESGCRYIETAVTNNWFVARARDPREVWVVDALTGTKVQSDFQPYEVMWPDISADGQYVFLNRIAAIETPCLDVYWSATGKHITSVPVYSTGLRNFAVSQDGKHLVTHSEETPFEKVELVMWEIASNAPKKVCFDTKVGGISIIEFVHNDKYIAALQQYPQSEGIPDCKLRIFDVSNGKEIHHSGGYVRDSLRTINTKSFLYITKAGATEGDNMLCYFDLDKLGITKEHNVHTVGHISISSCGTYCIDTALKVYDLKQGRLLQTFSNTNKTQIRQHRQTYPSITFDGRYVAWLNIIEGYVNVGEVQTGNVIGKIFTHSTPLSLSLTKDNILLVGTDDGYIMMYSIVDSSEAVKNMCDSLLNSSAKSTQKSQKQKRQNGQSKTCVML